MTINIFGIRHHGPGSAKSLGLALEEIKPDIILIEGPPECDSLINFVANEELKPPVALLIYNPKEFRQAAYYPFTNFSPEWQAMKFATQNDIEVRFMDLPQGIQFTLNKQKETEITLDLEEKTEDTTQADLLTRDPLSYMAELAGFKDSERWWETTFEHIESQAAVFPAILELMTALREEMGREESRETLLREAYMRKTIRQAQKEGFKNIAVVCGAWHSPVLNPSKFKASQDTKALRGIKKTSTKATWVPWSYDRIATSSGYGAGVVSPAWYAFLFDAREGVVIRWMAEVARLFRKKDVAASSAHIIEAVRLADALSLLRELPLPGIAELHQSATTIFCEGDVTPMKLIEKELIVGMAIGKIPKEIPAIPFQQDLEKKIKSARLAKHWEVSGKVDKKLNTRTPTQLAASHLLHRMNLLGIPWGKKQSATGREKGSFSEYWRLEWEVSFSLAIIEAGMWGNTLETAAVNFAIDKGGRLEKLAELTVLIQQVLDAELSAAIPVLIRYLQNKAAITKDVGHMMNALHPLVQIVRYGNTRKTEVGAVSEVVDGLIPRICISLPPACTGINEEAAAILFKQIVDTNRAISVLQDPYHNESWNVALHQISEMTTINSLLKGASSRILFDKSVVSLKGTAQSMSFALSSGNESGVAAAWIEGFLHGSGLLLLYNNDLWTILDEWVAELRMDDFEEILPLLRRTFAQFVPNEREKMMNLAKGQDAGVSATTEDQIDLERAKQVLPVLELILGQK